MALRHDHLSYDVKRTTAYTGFPKGPVVVIQTLLRWMRCVRRGPALRKVSSVRGDALHIHSARVPLKGCHPQGFWARAAVWSSAPGRPCLHSPRRVCVTAPLVTTVLTCVSWTNTRQAAQESWGRPWLPPPRTSPRHTAVLLKARLLSPPLPRLPTGPCTGRGLKPTSLSREVSSETHNK